MKWGPYAPKRSFTEGVWSKKLGVNDLLTKSPHQTIMPSTRCLRSEHQLTWHLKTPNYITSCTQLLEHNSKISMSMIWEGWGLSAISASRVSHGRTGARARAPDGGQMVTVEGRYEHLDLQMNRYCPSHECHADEARDHDGPDRRAVEVRRLRRL